MIDKTCVHSVINFRITFTIYSKNLTKHLSLYKEQNMFIRGITCSDEVEKDVDDDDNDNVNDAFNYNRLVITLW